MKKCINSWKKYCPDFEIKEWNENNFDINSKIYTKIFYKKKKWAFVSDYVRMYALHDY
jgi:mannosyltransferase OCH1-like enzyme